MREFLSTAAAFLLAGAIVVGGISLVGGLCLLPSWIGWLLYNHAVAPVFGWPHASFWLVFAVLWVIGLVGRIFK